MRPKSVLAIPPSPKPWTRFAAGVEHEQDRAVVGAGADQKPATRVTGDAEAFLVVIALGDGHGQQAAVAERGSGRPSRR